LVSVGIEVGVVLERSMRGRDVVESVGCEWDDSRFGGLDHLGIGKGPSDGPGKRGGKVTIVRNKEKDLPASVEDVLGFGGVGGAVDLKPELGNPVLCWTDVAPWDRWVVAGRSAIGIVAA
jgi:hypothetical protein